MVVNGKVRRVLMGLSNAFILPSSLGRATKYINKYSRTRVSWYEPVHVCFLLCMDTSKPVYNWCDMALRTRFLNILRLDLVQNIRFQQHSV